MPGLLPGSTFRVQLSQDTQGTRPQTRGRSRSGGCVRAGTCGRRLQPSAETTYGVRDRRLIRIIRPEHPLLGRSFPLVRLWEGRGTRFFVIELSDGGHCRIPMSWADDGHEVRREPELPPNLLTVESARALIEAVSLLRTRVSATPEGRHEEAARSIRGRRGRKRRDSSPSLGGGASAGDGVTRRSSDQAGDAAEGGSR